MNPLFTKMLLLTGVFIIILGIILLILYFLCGNTLFYDKPTHYPSVVNPCPDSWIASKGRCLFASPDSLKRDYYDINAYDKQVIQRAKTQAYGQNNGTILKPKDVYGIDFDVSFTTISGSIGWVHFGDAMTCEKKKWANRNAVHWDGISNNQGCK